MAEQERKLILETEYKVSGVDVSLQKMAQYKESTDAITESNLKKVEADKRLEQSANQLGRTVETQTKKQSDFARAVEDTGKVMEQVAQKNSLEKAFNKTSVIQTLNKQISDTRDNIRGIEKDISALDRQISRTAPGTNQQTLIAERNAAKRALDEEKGALVGYQEEVKRAREVNIALSTQLRRNRDELLKLEQAGQQGTQRYKELREETIKLKSAIDTANAALRRTSSATEALDVLVDTAKAGTGALAAYQGIATLVAESDEELAKTAQKAQGALSAFIGVQSVVTELRRADNIVVRAATLAQQVYTSVVGTSTGATKAFRIALLASGIGVALVALTALVSMFSNYNKEAKEATEENLRNQRIQESTIENYGKEAAVIEVAKGKLKDANITQGERVSIIKDLQQRYPAYLGNLNAETASYDQITAALDKLNQALFLKFQIQAREEEIVRILKDKIRLEQASTKATEDNNRVIAERNKLQTQTGSVFDQVNGEIATVAEGLANVFSGAADTAKKDIDDLINLIIEDSRKLSELGGDPLAQGARRDAALVEGSIRFYEAQVARLTKLRNESVAAASDQAQEFDKQLRNAQKQLEEAKALFADPVEVEFIAEGSLKQLQFQVDELNKILSEIGAGPEQERIARQVTEAEAELAALRERLFPSRKSQAIRFNTELENEEERHQLEMQSIEGDSQSARLKTQLSFARERLRLAEEFNAQAEEKDKLSEVELQKLQNRVIELEAAITKAQEDESQKRKQLSDKEFQDRLNGIQQLISAAAAAARALIDIEIRKYEELSRLQEGRVRDAERIADRGNSQVLKEEERRLNEINKLREKFVRRQQALAQIELVANAAVAVAKAVAAGAGTPLVALTVGATLLALAAGLAEARAQAQSFQSFRKGGQYSQRGGYTGTGPASSVSLGVGPKPYEYHKDEYIMPSEVLGIGNNLDWFKKIHTNRIDIGKLVKEKSNTIVIQPDNGLKDALSKRPEFQFNLNSEGIISIVEREGNRRKRIQSKR